MPGLASFCRQRFKPVWQKQVSASFCQSYLSVAKKQYNFLMCAAVTSHLCAIQMFFLHTSLIYLAALLYYSLLMIDD